MKKLIVIGIVLTMVMGLAAAASADFVKNTDWQVYIQAGSTTWSTVGGGGYTGSGTALILGDSSGAVIDHQGANPSGATAVIRQYDAAGGTYGFDTNTETALDQTLVAQTQEWDNLGLWLNGYTASTLAFRIWGAGVTANGPAITLTCVTAMTNSGFTVGQSWTGAQLTGGSKQTPATTFTLNATTLKGLGSTAANPIATFKLTAVTPAAPAQTPEPGSMLAMFSGLVGLVGFGIRRRK